MEQGREIKIFWEGGLFLLHIEFFPFTLKAGPPLKCSESSDILCKYSCHLATLSLNSYNIFGTASSFSTPSSSSTPNLMDYTRQTNISLLLFSNLCRINDFWNSSTVLATIAAVFWCVRFFSEIMRVINTIVSTLKPVHKDMELVGCSYNKTIPLYLSSSSLCEKKICYILITLCSFDLNTCSKHLVFFQTIILRLTTTSFVGAPPARITLAMTFIRGLLSFFFVLQSRQRKRKEKAPHRRSRLLLSPFLHYMHHTLHARSNY